MSLGRFVGPLEATHAQALAELRAGAKRGHWMWWIFPQLRGLGRSETARLYGIADRAEAEAFLHDPRLGPRLVEAARAMLENRGRRAEDVLGAVDALKLRSSATLFASLPGAPPEFAALLEAFFDGEPCARTQGMLEEP